ncbi:hypothetical protein CJ030_MR7G000804 [Morella rubra]|uniref:RNase H type-1 domain-containing protein n=1 Tax=Morella rubra TaxID=262757 RepID=A0A6A1VA29_9ROSI|nr:hypothetical protein CJ030_MR7G000804 [Morella rubra]
MDIAIRETFRVAAAVLRNTHHGVAVGAVVQKVAATLPVEGEALAAQLGAAEAKKCEWRQVVLESDSVQVVRAVNSFPRWWISVSAT